MNDRDFFAAMSLGIPPLPTPADLVVTDCTEVLTGNRDLELSEAERIGEGERA